MPVFEVGVQLPLTMVHGPRLSAMGTPYFVMTGPLVVALAIQIEGPFDESGTPKSYWRGQLSQSLST